MKRAVVVMATVASVSCGSAEGRPLRSWVCHATIPLTVVQGANGTFLVARVAVGGAKPVPVIVDTGSNQLMIRRQAVGRWARISPKVRVLGGYGVSTNPVTGSTATATFTIHGVPNATTTKPISFGAVTSFGSVQVLLSATGTQGIMGIGQLPSSSRSFFSPLLSLPSPLWKGYTIALQGPGGPKLILGRPTRAASSVSVALLGPRVRVGPFGGPHTPKKYPSGTPAYQGLFRLCWSIAGEKACGATVADTGNTFGFVGSGLLPNVPNTSGFVTPGLQISISTPPPRSRVVRAYRTDARVADQLPLYLTTAPFIRMFSTGIGLYYADTVGYDLVRGQAVITPVPHR
jgi:hypothetical protein